MPANEYVEIRNGAFYLGGTRIGLDVVVYDFRRGRTAEAIFENLEGFFLIRVRLRLSAAIISVLSGLGN
jgi:hypothetical protein